MIGVVFGAFLVVLGGASVWRTDALIALSPRRHDPGFKADRIRRAFRINGRVCLVVGSFFLILGIVSLTE